MASKTYRHARVSSRDQNLGRQANALARFGIAVPRVFADRASGRDFEQPEYRRMLAALPPGDTVVVKSIDLFGRNYEEIIEEWQHITRDEGCSIVLQPFFYVTEKERDFIRQRQAEGIAASQECGVPFERPPQKRPKSYARAKATLLDVAITKKEAAERLRVSPTTFEKWIREDGERR